jgi:hypothetical protein
MRLTAEITHEIAQAIRKLGGNPETVTLTDSFQVNRTLGFLSADIYLLCTVGSWRDTASDEETLRDLRTWNAGGSLQPETSFINK